MEISKKIKLNNNIYWIIVEVEYKMHEQGFPYLVLNNFKDDYWDSGDFTRLIERVEESYSIDKSKKYDEVISYMGDILFIYNIPLHWLKSNFAFSACKKICLKIWLRIIS